MRTAALTLSLPLLTACSFNVGGYANENDRLRDELAQTRDALDQTRRERTELLAKLNELSRQQTELGPDAQAVLQALPRCALIEFDSFTELVDRDNLPGYEAIDVYVYPRDARNRFVQVAGTLRLTAHRQPDDINDSPTPLASLTLEPLDLREAYRRTIFTVHYYAQLPLSPPLQLEDPPTDFRPVILDARFDDALTGLTHTARRELNQAGPTLP